MSRKNSNAQSSRSQASLSPSPSTSPTSQALTTTTGSILLLVFIHGFKGTDTTFEEFPQRLQHLLTQTVPNLNVESLVFPAYETKGELDKAVVLFADWLTTAVVEREVASGGGAGSAKIVLCGHSMGGLLAADSLRGFIDTRPDSGSPLWPRIIACLAFDTPYLGLHPNLVKDGVTKAADHVNAASTIGSALFGSFAGFTAGKAAQGAPSSTPAAPNAAAAREPAASGWTKWAGPAAYAIGGALLAGAAAGGAYYARDHLNTSYTWLMDHMKYVGNLWDEATLNKRVETLVDIEEVQGVVFRNFYTVIPPSAPTFLESRTFSVLPRLDSRVSSRFIPSKNTVATDEIAAHTGMFSASTNDGYYDLGLAVAKVVREAYGKAAPASATSTSTSRSARRRSSAHSPGTSSPPQPRSRAAQTKGTPGPQPAGPLSSEKAQEDLIRL